VPLPDVEELEPVDAVLVSHAHHDHLDPRSIARIARNCPVIAPRGCGRILRRRGIGEIIEVAAGDRLELDGIFVEALPALHDGRRYPVGRKRPALGYLLEGPPSVYFVGDTDVFPEMGELAGRVDTAAVPVSGWGPRVPAGHLDPERAARAVGLIRPRIAIPIHWGTLFALNAKDRVDPAAPARAFARAVAEHAPGVEVRILQPGSRLRL
jgi:L-ascorbate metabolism protein UlaG (beta-lactamase superfamily)